LALLYKKTESEKVVLQFNSYQQTASIKIDVFEANHQRYLKAYFIVNKPKGN